MGDYNKSGIQIERKLWLDALRGVAMILVVYGHCVQQWAEFFAVTSPVKMPLFFVISGYLFKTRGGNQKEFFKNLFLKLVVPWMALGLFPYTHPFIRFMELISGKALWFMPCLIIGEIVWFYIRKFSKNDIQIISWGIMACIIGFILDDYLSLNYAIIGTALVVQVYFVMGYLIRKYEMIFDRCWIEWVSIACIVYIGMVGMTLLYFPGEFIDVHLNRYFNMPLCSLMIVVGCFTLFTVFRNVDVSPQWLVYIGQNTLVVYILHSFFFYIIKESRQLFSFGLDMPLPLEALVKTVVAIMMCCIVAFVLNRYFPVLVGKKRTCK